MRKEYPGGSSALANRSFLEMEYVVRQPLSQEYGSLRRGTRRDLRLSVRTTPTGAPISWSLVPLESIVFGFLFLDVF